MAGTIDRETLKKKLDAGEDFHLVEVLAEKEFERLHIRGAENIPFGKVIEEAKRRFSKNDEVVVYCADEECKASPKAAEKLETFGFTKVKEYPGGKKEWREAGYPMEGTEA
jgi:rhodanese-related sulfurtransferase